MPQAYNQTATQKPVTRLAPDAFMLLNQQPYLVGGDNNVYFNNDIQTINIQGSVDSPPASASFTLIVPRSIEGNYFNLGQCIIQNMMEVQIYIKGRFHVLGSDGTIQVPPPILQFWGVVTSVADDYSGDQHTITVECKDMLYWMQITKMNARPSCLSATSSAALVTPSKSIFQRSPPKEIIKYLVNFAYGGARTGPDGQSISAAFVPETFSSSISFTMGVQNNPFTNISQNQFIQYEENAVQTYWRTRFGMNADQTTDTNIVRLLIYSYASSSVVNPTSINVTNPLDTTTGTGGATQPQQPEVIPYVNDSANVIFKTQAAINAQVAQSTGVSLSEQQLDNAMDNLITNAHPYGEISSVDTISAEYSSLLDMAIYVKDYIGYEFYMSLDGQILFKPPFFNIDVKPYRPMVIKDEDVVSFSLTQTDDVFTVFAMRGNLTDQIHTDTHVQDMGIAFDANLAQQYGLRIQQSDIQMAANITDMKQSQFLALYAQNEMDRHNARRYQGSITVMGTPEIKLGYPVYIESRDCYGYVTTINHSFSFGSTFTTTITVEALRFNTDLGPNMAYVPGPIDDQTINDAGQPNYTATMLDQEQRGNISGSGIAMNRTRVLQQIDASSVDPTLPLNSTGTNFITDQTQRITDLDGYGLIGVISYGADLLIDPTGNFQMKTNALNLDTNTMSVNVIASMAPSSVNPQPNAPGAIPTSNALQPTAQGIGNIAPTTSSSTTTGGV